MLDDSLRLGKIVVLDVADRAAAEKIIAEDPFVRVGLSADYTVRRFRLSVDRDRLKSDSSGR